VVLHFGDAGREARAGFESGGVRDESLRARLWIAGKDRVEFVNGQCTNDVRLVTPDTSLTAALTTPKGRVVDWIQVFHEDQRLGLIGSAGQTQVLSDGLSRKIIMEDCSVEDAAPALTPLLAFGPRAPAAVERVFGKAPGTRQQGHAAVRTTSGDAPAWLLGTPAPAGRGVLVLVAPAHAGDALARLVEAGLQPTGEQAFEQLRIESGIPALGKELGDHCNPLEAGLRDSVSFNKGCYVGQEVIARLQHYSKVKRQLVGIRFAPGADVGGLNEVFWDLLRIGELTSATHSERLGATVGLALVKSDYAAPGTEVYCVRDAERIEGKVEALPFA
jgi:folate-binding protein YgfZ